MQKHISNPNKSYNKNISHLIGIIGIVGTRPAIGSAVFLSIDVSCQSKLDD